MIAGRLRVFAPLLALAVCTASAAAAPDRDAVNPLIVRVPTLEVPERPDFEGITGELTQGGWVRGKAPSNTVKLTLNDQPVALAEDGSFFAAFDRDAAPTASLIATYDSGHQRPEKLKISPRDWQVSYVNVARGRGNDLEAYWAKREPEYNAIRDARAKRTGAQGWKQDFIWPVKARISGLFGRQRVYAGEPADYHGGIDIAAGGGTPFVAPADGVVVLARTGFSLEGGIIIVDHGAGLNSAFIHLSRLVVKEGQSVSQGQYLGDVGGTGRASGPHLHWSVMWNEARIDPLLLTGPM